MDEYTRLRNELESYMEMPDIEMDKNQLSLYDLYRIVDTKLEELRRIQFDSDFKDEINKDQRKIGRLFKKKVNVSDHACKKITSLCNGKKSEITFRFDAPHSYFGSEALSIYKDIDSDEIYFGHSKTDKPFVEKYYDRICDFFSILEEFSALYQGGVGSCGEDNKQVFSDGFLDIKLSYDTYGRVYITPIINSHSDPERIYNREWLKRQTLSEYVKENQDTILKKIPAKISELNYTTKTIVENYLSKINAPQLIKKR